MMLMSLEVVFDGGDHEDCGAVKSDVTRAHSFFYLPLQLKKSGQVRELTVDRETPLDTAGAERRSGSGVGDGNGTRQQSAGSRSYNIPSSYDDHGVQQQLGRQTLIQNTRFGIYDPFLGYATLTIKNPEQPPQKNQPSVVLVYAISPLAL
jgi:hypothetical protein